jgi:hypothetical protein
MNAVVSRYRFHDSPDGFSVEGDERPPVEVHFQPTGLEARYAETFAPGASERFGFFNFGKLLEFVARGLMRDWQPVEGWFGARAWAQQQTARAIARRLREHWLRLISRANSDVLAVQRAIFAVTFGDAPLAAEPAFYRNPFLVQDVLHFPACAIAVRNAWTLTRELPIRRLSNSTQARELHALARSMGLSLHLHTGAPTEPDVSAQLERLADWKALFADTGESYRSLNRTLMNLPGRIPHRLVCNLRRVHLERPLEHRLEVLVVALYAGIRADREEAGESRVDHGHLIQHARPAQIRSALARLAQHLHQPLDLRRSSDLRQLVQFVADYSEAHEGNLAGLIDRAVRWHRDQQQEQMAAMRRHYGADTATAAPPIPLPEIAEVRFLDTVGAICTEAEQMQHCIASYIDLAVQGNCYLFHVSHRGEEATIEVGWEGKVRQSQGPRNQRNRASIWGKRVLERWAAQLPRVGHPGRRCPLGLDEEEIPF